jgi:hypothetical protein
MAVLQGKLRGARLTVGLQVLFAYSPMGRGDLQIVSAPRELQAFAVGGWEAGRLGAAWAERWQWQTGSGSSLARDVTVDHRLAKWACGLARGPCSKARLGPVGARPTAILQHKLFHLLGTYQETGHPTNSSRRITHSLNSHQATHSPLTSHYSPTNVWPTYPALPISAWPEVHVHNPTQVTQPNDPTINKHGDRPLARLVTG